MVEKAHITADHLIVKSFERMYREYAKPAGPGDVAYYSMPRVGVPPSDVVKQYRGICRDALEAWTQDELEHGYPGIPTPTESAACLVMAELQQVGLADDDFIFSPEGARRVFASLRKPDQWELIWASKHDYAGSRPAGTSLLGFEPTWWTGDHFSAVMDSMCFPRWHGPDPEGTLLTEFHDRLNRHALFTSASDAELFLVFYRSQAWAETGEFAIAEVRLES